jgi:hypothetical protein
MRRLIKRGDVEADRAGPHRTAARSAISATTVEESTPPERNAPSGTSAIIRLVTASRR